MLVKVVFPYQATYFRVRCRNAETKLFAGETTVDIADKSSEDMPVAVEIRRITFAPMQVRHDGTDFWWPVRNPVAGGLVEPEPWIRAVGDGGYGHDLLKLSRLTDGLRGTFPKDRFPELGIREIVASGHDEAMAYVHRQAADVVLCEGLVLVRGSEPVYVNSPFHGPKILPLEEAIRSVPRAAERGLLWRLDETEIMAARFPGEDATVLAPGTLKADMCSPPLREAAGILAKTVQSIYRYRSDARSRAVCMAADEVSQSYAKPAHDLLPPIEHLVALVKAIPPKTGNNADHEVRDAEIACDFARRRIAAGTVPAAESPADAAALGSLSGR